MTEDHTDPKTPAEIQHHRDETDRVIDEWIAEPPASAATAERPAVQSEDLKRLLAEALDLLGEYGDCDDKVSATKDRIRAAIEHIPSSSPATPEAAGVTLCHCGRKFG